MAWLYKQAGSKYWWIGYRQNGRQILQSTKKETKAEADKVLAQFNAIHSARDAGMLTQEFYHALTNTPNVRKPLKVAVESWLATCQTSTAADTHERYCDVGKSFLDFLKATDEAPTCQDITSTDIQGFLGSIRAARAVATVNLYRNIVAMFFVWCMEQNFIQKNPARSVKKFKATAREIKSRRAFTLAEIQTMHSVAPSDFWRYMIIAGFFTGLRMGDLITATWANFDLGASMIRLVAGKTEKPVNIPIAPRLKTLVQNLKATTGRVKGSDYLWPTEAHRYQERGAGEFSNQFYDEVLLPAGLVAKRTKKKKKDGKGRAAARVVTSVSFHCLRHTFVSVLKLTGANQSTAKELAGHSSDAMNAIYTHTPEAVLIDAVSRLDDELKKEQAKK